MKTNHILALLAFTGGITAAFTNHSARNHLYPTWEYESDRIQREKVNFISASHLADLLYRKEEGFILLDFRNEEQYESYHIPTAQNYQRWVGDSEPKKTWFIVYGMSPEEPFPGVTEDLPGKVFVLKGGIDAWYSTVLFPDFAQYKVRNTEILLKVIDRTRYFGGSPGNTQLLNINLRGSRYREGC